MLNKIWAGRCEDCYTIKPVAVCSGDFLPGGLIVELCDGCASFRRRLREQGCEPRDVGLLMDGKWSDAPPISILVGGQNITVSVKFLTDSHVAGIVRLRFNNVPQWFPAGVFGWSPVHALFDARMFLEKYYFVGQPIKFIK